MQNVVERLVNEYYSSVPRGTVGMAPVSVALLVIEAGDPGGAYRILFDHYPPATAQEAWNAISAPIASSGQPLSMKQTYARPLSTQPVRQETSQPYSPRPLATQPVRQETSQPYSPRPLATQPIRQAPVMWRKPSGEVGPTESKMSVLATLLTIGVVGGLFWWVTSGPSFVSNPADDD